jgi:2-keto-4-pentenoate hydratase/2-oxohepta-3-ene-1,7-dioic acid hydratase in catechol pathway
VSLPILRTAGRWWVADGDTAAPLDVAAGTTGQLLADRAALRTAADAALAAPARTRVADLEVVSPVTAPCRVVAQMTNYVSHVRDSGLDPATVPLTFFRKASGSLSGPFDDVVKPPHVRLLDYEVEIGLVIGDPLPVGQTVGPGDLERHVAALVVANDVSARDVQLPKTQFYEAKSYPTFTPVGPVLLVLEPGELGSFGDLRLTTTVNGQVRQASTVADMIYRPLEALQALSRFQALATGDLVLTGTPGGTALTAPPKPVEILGRLLPPSLKWRLFFDKQAKNPRYLRDGDLLELRVATDDGALDCGTQRTRVRYA